MSQLDTRIPMQVPNVLAEQAQISAMSAADQSTRNNLATQLRQDAIAPIARNALAAQTQGAELQNVAAERQILGQALSQFEQIPEAQRAAMWPKFVGDLAGKGVLDPQLAQIDYSPDIIPELRMMAAPPAAAEMTDWQRKMNSLQSENPQERAAAAFILEGRRDPINVPNVGLVDPDTYEVLVAQPEGDIKPIEGPDGNLYHPKTAERMLPNVEAPPKESPIAALEARAEAAGLVPGTPEYQQFMMNNGQVKKPEGPDLTAQAGLRKEWMANNKDFKNIRDSYVKVQGAAKSPSAANDLALVFSYMKMLDPGSVVRETEFANAQNAAGVPERVRNVWNNLKSGEILNEVQRNDFVGVARQVYEDQENIYRQDLERYRGIASAGGLDPTSTIPDITLAPAADLPPVAGEIGFIRTLSDNTRWRLVEFDANGKAVYEEVSE